jgi:hypothetical protein
MVAMSTKRVGSLFARLSVTAPLLLAACDSFYDGGTRSDERERNGIYDEYGDGAYQDGHEPADFGTWDPACRESFAVSFAIPPKSGDCKLVVEGPASGGPSATYYLAEPASDATSTCVALEGPELKACKREADSVTFASGSLDDVTQLREALDVTREQKALTVTLSCARALESWSKPARLRCTTPTVAAPTVQNSDAGADATQGASSDAGVCPH